MKTILGLLCVSVLSISAQATTVQGARVDEVNKIIEVDVSYGGGCVAHEFKLKVNACQETFPVGCSVTVIDTTTEVDMCEAYISKTIKFSMEEYGLTSAYYDRAAMTIMGANNSKATVTLPGVDVVAVDRGIDCSVKQKNVASYALAQEIGVPVQGAQVVGYEHGIWTEAVGNNVGSDTVVVRIGNRLNRGMTIKTYNVAAKQIGNTRDCNVTAVKSVK